MTICKKTAAALLMATMLCESALSGGERALSNEQWRADLAQMAGAIRDIHFKPFARISEAEFDRAIAALGSEIPELSDAEIIIAMAEIVARMQDGHTRLHLPRQFPEFALEAELGHSGTQPPRDERLRFHQLPVQFALFEDGLFVTGTSADHAGLIAQKVTGIGKLPTDEAIERARAVGFFENDSRARLLAPDRLALPEVLHALKITEDVRRTRLRTRSPGGDEQETTLEPLAGDTDGWVSGIPAPPPLWLRQRERSEWFTELGESNAVYVQVNRFDENPGRPYAAFVAQSLQAARKAGADRYILDLRHNSGGIGAWTIPFVTGLTRSEYNRFGRLYILIGRTTFSAAQHLLHQLEAYSYAIFVGEPGGAKPSHYSDPKRVILEHSGLTLRVSTLYWHSWLANDFRDAISPHIDAPLTSKDFFSGRDPALEAVIGYQPPATIAGQIDEQFRAGNNQNGLLLFQRYLTDATFTGLEPAIPELVTMANALIDDGFIRPGMFVFLMVDRSYPGIAEVEAGLARARKLIEKSENQVSSAYAARARDGRAL